MAQSVKDTRINDLLDANSQLNATVKQLMAALFAKSVPFLNTFLSIDQALK